MGERSDRFLELSGLLTGFGRVDLLGTGMTDAYLHTLDDVLPAGVIDALLAAYEGLPAGSEREPAVASQILGDPKLGPVARNLILLWYCGTWTALPDAWRAAYGNPPTTLTGVVSGDAYQAGLQWVVAGAHPPGASPQGFGAWALAPGEIRR
jgi:hypothetical protein